MFRKLSAVIILFIMCVSCGAVKQDKTAENNDQQKPEAVAPVHPESQPDASDSSRVTPTVLAIRKIEDSVVNIRTEKTVETNVSPFFNDPFFDDFFGMRKRSYKTQSLGSGVFVHEDGTVVTNYHVVKDATTIFLITRDNANYEAEFIGGDEAIDLAVLKIKDDNKKFPAATLGTSSDIMLGEPIIAIGNPYGLSSSVTTGVISATARMMNIGNNYSVFIQTDALINPGNSGGPLININGEVIGINTAIHRQAQGIGFSIPADTIKRVLPEIAKNGKLRRGHVGFTVKDTAKGDDVVPVIESVEKNSNAAEIGLKTGDEVIELGGVPINSEEVMYHILRSYPPGSAVEIGIRRPDGTFKGRLVLTERPSDFGLKYLDTKYGIAVIEKDGYLTVAKSGNAKYIREGDIVIAFNNTEMDSLDQLSQMIEDNQDKAFLLTVYRDGRLLQVKLNP
jgi:serine protease Do